MARNLTTAQRTMLRSGSIKARLLTTWYMDGGTYRYCDDVQDLTDGTNTWIGANAIASAADVKSGSGFSSEQLDIIIDGTRIYASGADPAAFFQAILDLPLVNRRVDFALGIAYPDDTVLGLVLPLYAGKISNVKLVDPQMTLEQLAAQGYQFPPSKLIITLDSLSVRYQWVSGRTRDHQDQLAIDPTDMFFSFVQNNLDQGTLYWGKATPNGSASRPGFIGAGSGVGPNHISFFGPARQ